MTLEIKKSKSRRSSLKRTEKRGYTRNLGRKANGIQPKFYLGHDRDEAVVRDKRLVALWDHIEEWVGMPKTVWTTEYFEVAKSIASGEIPEIPAGQCENGEHYVIRLRQLSESMGCEVQPLHDGVYEWGLEQLKSDVDRCNEILDRPSGSTGQTLHQALRAFQEYIKKRYKDKSEGTIKDNGMSKLRQIKAIMEYVPDDDLASLDFAGTEAIFNIFVSRPISKRYGTLMTRKSCSNYIGELGRFFKWLHRQRQFSWRKPEDFDCISLRPDEVDEDIEREAEEVPTWTIDELVVINSYATPIERIFFLLGLNCAYGADQSGRLRIRHLHQFDGGQNFLNRIRVKRKTRSIHLLWTQTEEGLLWAMERRKQQEYEDDTLLLTEDCLPYWRKTEGGNRCQAVPRLWKELFRRIRKDHPKFRWLPFNSFRDTSANMIRQIAGEATASVHLAHKHQAEDKNLRNYTNPDREKHFQAIRQLGKQLQPVLEAAGPEPWKKRPKSYIGRDKVKQLLRLRKAGVPVRKIAAQLGTSASTVYRNLEAYGEN